MRTKRKGLINKADKLWAEQIKERDKQTCQKCLSTSKQLNACHFYSRSYKSIRWNLDNGVCLCVGCHFWGHKNPLEFTLWFQDWAGHKTVEMLTFKKQGKGSTSLFNLEMIVKELNERS